MKTETYKVTWFSIKVLAFPVLVITSISLAAETNIPPTHPRLVGRHVQQDITKWDLNKNERLDPDELEAFRRDKLRERHDQMELRTKAAAAAHRAQAEFRATNSIVLTAKAIKKYDANTNGRLDREELLQYREDLAKLRAEKQRALSAANAVPSASNLSTNSPTKP